MRTSTKVTLLLACCLGRVATAADPQSFVTEHAIDVDGGQLEYRAVVEEMRLADAATRPVTFLFNVGPGSSSVWLHLGGIGPQRFAMHDNGMLPAGPPYELVPNPQTLLRFTDLVFVDPVGTGYSRPADGVESTDFWGVDEDARSVAELIRTWLDDNDRRASPKYLLGESYGTIRVSVLVRELLTDREHSIALDGVILLSTAVDSRIFLSGRPGNELAYVTNLPTYAVTAFHHDRLPEKPADREAFLNEAREFAANEYLTALFRGDTLSEDQAEEIAEDLHRFTGVSKTFWLRNNLRIDSNQFARRFAGRRQMVAAYDTRFIGRAPQGAGAHGGGWDTYFGALMTSFDSAVHEYLEEELEVDVDREYVVFEMAANMAWQRPGHEQHVFGGYLYTMPFLAAGASRYGLRIFVASGYHDLTTTYFGVEHAFDHSGIDKDLISLRNYDGGHMMYLYDPSLEAMSADLQAFYGVKTRPTLKRRRQRLP
jgi:carboxypeptidase C (cathepsin A)